MNITSQELREILLQTRAKPLMNAPGWDSVLEDWAVAINRFIEAYRDRYGQDADPVRLFNEDPYRGAAFFELDTLRLSTLMKMAVWRIIMGNEIEAVELSFDRNGGSRICISLHGDDKKFESANPEDFRFVRHLGTITINNRFQIQGYYAFAK